MNPAAYLAEISQKGNINIEAKHNGKNILADYMTAGTKAVNTDEQTPESWMNQLMGSEDAALGYGGGEDKGLFGNLMQMFMTLLMLTIQMENKSKEEKMQAVCDAVINRRIDISSFVPNQKSAVLSINDNGNAILVVNDGKHEYTHELSNAEKDNIANILHGDSDNTTKKQRIGCMVNAITFSHQAANNYEQIEAQRQSQEQTIQRR